MRKFKKTKYTIEDGVTQSMLTDFLACRQRMAFHLAGWETKRARSTFRFGSMVHKVLEHVGRAMRAGEKDLQAVMVRAVNVCLAANLIKSSSADIAHDMEIEAGKAKAVLGEYLLEWADDRKKTWLELEPIFDVNFRGYRLRGRMDGVFRQKKTDLRLLETKTKGNIKESLTVLLNFDFQSLFYLTALRLMVDKPKQIKGVLYNVIRNPQLRMKKATTKKPAETADEFIERVREAAQKDPDHYFKRFELSFPSEIVEVFEDELEAKLREYKMWLEEELPTYKSEGACSTMWDCEFLNACATDSKVGFAQTRVLFRELLDEEGEDDGHNPSTKKTKGKAKAKGKGKGKLIRRKRK